MATNLIQNKII